MSRFLLGLLSDFLFDLLFRLLSRLLPDLLFDLLFGFLSRLSSRLSFRLSPPYYTANEIRVIQQILFAIFEWIAAEERESKIRKTDEIDQKR